MDPKTLNLIMFAEQMAALAAETFTEVRGLLMGSSSKTVDQVLDDADSKYQAIIDKAQAGPNPPATT